MIFVNAVYQFVDKNERIRIIYVSTEEELCAYVYIEKELSVPIIEEVSVVKEEIDSDNLIEITDPYSVLIEEDNLTETQINKREERWAIIEQYWEPQKEKLLNKSTRMKKFKEISQLHNISLMRVRRMFSQFWQRGMTPNACLPDYKNSGAPGREKNFIKKTGRPRNITNKEFSLGINVDDKVKKQFEVSINKYYRTKQKKSLREVYSQMLEDFYSVTIKEQGETKRILRDPSNVPTYEQFYYWFKKAENPGVDFVKREGQKDYELTKRPITGTTKQEAPGPGFRFQIDATPSDIYIVSETDRSKVVGRATIYAIVDVFSRMITGIYVGLETNSWNGAMMSLDSMVANKSELCADYGVPLDEELWPSSHLPEAIIADRGEMLGHGVENLINNFKVAVENTSPYRADLKPIVERLFRTINEKIKGFLPGAVMKDTRKRGDPDYRLDAKLTLKEIRRIILLSVIDHNWSPIEHYQLSPEMVKDNVRPIPLELWNWGIENQKGCLRKVDRLDFRLGILPRAKATFSRGTVTFHKLKYGASELLENYNHMKLTDTKVDIVYDPRKIDNIYMIRNDSKPILLNLLDQSRGFAGLSLEEVIEINKKASTLKKSADDERLKNRITLNQEINTIAKKATKKTNEESNISTSKSKRLKDINKNRSEEKAIQKKEETLIQREENEDPAEIVSIEEELKEPNNGSEGSKSGNSEVYDLIRRRRDERRKK
ncbi:Mu transposase C-terminal domain-containing protein [Natranaerobius thermophilus]|uniref:Integrase catalytic region n=1 Tax=Natranaerobius thermophilus (strain ATCC BAA-1301 / DSM 18059 / JW/NM-WN-LF) TaxID=457570 RepID=B2A4S3_NATTJ|nr:Mu transposase C-terminal domain-containing protein [Natranaerobius thermophilus]ACB83845.1 Integrase catalytic region [Natranaerobius thermophilus JW/NM-WN-LF]